MTEVLYKELRPVSPPHLQWWAVALLSIITGGIFAAVWLVVISLWLRRVGRSVISLVFALLSLCTSASIIIGQLLHIGVEQYLGLIDCVFWFAAIYTVRFALTRDPVGITLGRVMTLLFGPVYFQYFLNDFPVEAIGYIQSSGKATNA